MFWQCVGTDRGNSAAVVVAVVSSSTSTEVPLAGPSRRLSPSIHDTASEADGSDSEWDDEEWRWRGPKKAKKTAGRRAKEAKRRGTPGASSSARCPAARRASPAATTASATRRRAASTGRSAPIAVRYAIRPIRGTTSQRHINNAHPTT